MDGKNQTLKSRARDLRKAQTPQERHLWFDFLKQYPVRFQRQKVFGNYIVDFYCHQAKLVVELDGSQHFEPEDMEYDRRRTAYLNSLGIRVLRYANNQINEEFKEVCDHIDYIIRTKLHLDE